MLYIVRHAKLDWTAVDIVPEEEGLSESGTAFCESERTNFGLQLPSTGNIDVIILFQYNYIHCMQYTRDVIICQSIISVRNKDQKLVGRFLENQTFYRFLIDVPLKMYSKFDRPKWILVGQMLKLVGKWAVARCYFSH